MSDWLDFQYLRNYLMSLKKLFAKKLWWFFFSEPVYMCFTSPGDNMEENKLISCRFQWDCSITCSEMSLIRAKARHEPGWIFKVLHCSSSASQCFCSFLSSQTSATSISLKSLMNHAFFALYPRFSPTSFLTWSSLYAYFYLTLLFNMLLLLLSDKGYKTLSQNDEKIRNKKPWHVKIMDLWKFRPAIIKKKKRKIWGKRKKSSVKKKYKILYVLLYYRLESNPTIWSFGAYLCTQEQTQCSQQMNAATFCIWLLVWCSQSQMAVVSSFHSVWPWLHTWLSGHGLGI